MFARLTIGQYFPGNSIVHRLEPRTKMLAALVYMVVLLMGKGWLGVGYCALFTALWFLAARLPLATVVRGLRPILWLIVATLVLNVFLTPGRAVWALGPLHATAQGLTVGVRAGIRLGLLVFQATATTLTTRPLELTDAMERLGTPFRRLGLPAHELALMSSIALRFIPVLSEEADRILKAQEARGGGLRRQGFGLRQAASLLVPLLLAVFRRADELAIAMEARGYHGADGRTRYRTPRMGVRDALAGVVVLALAVVVIGTRW